MHIKIKICKNLWKLLFEAAMSFIDPDRRGYDDLFSYFDEYVTAALRTARDLDAREEDWLEFINTLKRKM